MKKPNKISNTTEAISQNVHRHDKWLISQRQNAEKRLTPKQFKWFKKYDDDLVMSGVSHATRHTNLTRFVKLVTEYNLEDLEKITVEQVKEIVVNIMRKHGRNGQESWYSQDTKKQLKHIIRFAKTGSRFVPDTGELSELNFIKVRTPKDKLAREDLPTDDDCKELLRACGNSPMDKAMLAVHMEAGTRIKELLSMQIKHVVTDEYGAMIAVDGKTGARKIRIVSSVPYLVKWINAHPYRDDPNHALFISTRNTTIMGCPLSYHGFNQRLKKFCRIAGITKRIHSHLFRHREITKLAGKLTEPEQRIRHGWSKSSSMPSRYSHLNNQDVDNKMLQIMGIKKKAVEEESQFIECQYCHIKHPIDTKYCETCAKPLDVVEAEKLQRESKEETQAMVYELMRQEKAKAAKNNYQTKRDKQLEIQMQAQETEIQMLKDMITKMSKAE
jgi:integrase/recombinase XerD